MKRTALLLLPLLALVGFVCRGVGQADRGPTAFDVARAAATDGALDERAQRRLWSGGSGRYELSCGGPSPDGTLFSLVDWLTGDLAVYDVAAGSVRRVTDKGTWNDNVSWNECSLFSPDGRRIAFNYGDAEGLERGFRYQLRVLDLEDTLASQKVLLELPPNQGWITPLDWWGEEILTLAMAGGGPRHSSPSTPGTARRAPSWSPTRARASPRGSPRTGRPSPTRAAMRSVSSAATAATTGAPGCATRV